MCSYAAGKTQAQSKYLVSYFNFFYTNGLTKMLKWSNSARNLVAVRGGGGGALSNDQIKSD